MRIFFFLIWLVFGSLGSVVMTRFADGITWTKLRGFFFWYSECPHCHHRLKAKNLVPLISYLVQWGECEYCKKKISRIYPVLELLSAGIFIFTYFLLKDFWIPTLLFWLLTNRLLMMLLIYDLKEGVLHMTSRVLLVIVGICRNIFLPGGNRWYAVLSALLFGSVFTWIYFFAKRYAKMRFNQPEWFGEGDIYLASTIWLLLPIFFPLIWITTSWWILLNVLILFVLMSSIIWLLRAWMTYPFRSKQLTWGTRDLWPDHLSIKSIPFFPAMIIAFRILPRKLPFFITLIFW